MSESESEAGGGGRLGPAGGAKRGGLGRRGRGRGAKSKGKTVPEPLKKSLVKSKQLASVYTQSARH